MSRVCVLGSLNMDLVARAPRLPDAGETILGGPFDRFPGGKGANQAVAARRLGASTVMIGAIGEDEFGLALRRELEAAGVEARLDARRDAPTGVALITIDPSGENTIVVAPGANAELRPKFVEHEALSIDTADVLVVQLECRLDAVAAGVRLARAGGTRVVLNAAPACELEDELLRDVDVLVVNRGEAVAVATTTRDAALEPLARALLARGPSLVVITLGADGAVAHDGRSLLRQPAFPVEAVDTVAAGDAFVAALAVTLAEGHPLPNALRFACAAGALATTTAGAQPSLPCRGGTAIKVSTTC